LSRRLGSTCLARARETLGEMLISVLVAALADGPLALAGGIGVAVVPEPVTMPGVPGDLPAAGPGRRAGPAGHRHPRI
jgi:hypothetical protein